MAKKNSSEEKLNYSAEIRRLREHGPERLYFLWGAEDYLREQYVKELKKICLPEGEDSFSYKRLDGPELDAAELAEAVDAVPFMSERSFVELRSVDLNHLEEPEDVLNAISDIPEYCTVCFVQTAQFEPDGRLKINKGIRSAARELKFSAQSQSMLIDWIVRRFAALNKEIELNAAQRLIFISGDLMSRLIPEIEKIAAYCKNRKVSIEDVEAVANHIPEAVIFDMTDYISQKKYNTAAAVLSELLSDKNNEPIPMLAMLGQQMRRLYAARLAIDKGLGTDFLVDSCGLKYEFIAAKLMSAARGYTMPQLKRAVELCAETDYRMKSSSGTEPAVLLKELVLRIAAGESDA